MLSNYLKRESSNPLRVSSPLSKDILIFSGMTLASVAQHFVTKYHGPENSDKMWNKCMLAKQPSILTEKRNRSKNGLLSKTHVFHSVLASVNSRTNPGHCRSFDLERPNSIAKCQLTRSLSISQQKKAFHRKP